MQPSTRTNVRKLYRRIEGGLPSGSYELHVGYNYPVMQWSARKHIVLATMGPLGGRNWFLPGAYLTLSLLCFGFCYVLIVIRRRSDRTLGDISTLTWDRRPRALPASPLRVPAHASTAVVSLPG